MYAFKLFAERDGKWFVPLSATYLYELWGLALFWAGSFAYVQANGAGLIVLLLFFSLDIWMVPVFLLLWITRSWLRKQYPERRTPVFKYIGVAWFALHFNPHDAMLILQGLPGPYSDGKAVLFGSLAIVGAFPLVVVVLMFWEIRQVELLMRSKGSE